MRDYRWVLGALAAALVAGCSGHAATTVLPHISPVASRSPSAPSSDSDRSARPSPTSTPRTILARWCGPTDVSTQIAIGPPVFGQVESEVRLTNTATTACSLRGLPRVRFANQHQAHLTVRAAQAVEPGAPTTRVRLVTLRPGQHAQFFLHTLTHPSAPKYPDCGDGNTRWSITLRPGQSSIVIGPFGLPACDGTTINTSPYTTTSLRGYDRGLTKLTPARPRAS